MTLWVWLRLRANLVYGPPTREEAALLAHDFDIAGRFQAKQLGRYFRFLRLLDLAPCTVDSGLAFAEAVSILDASVGSTLFAVGGGVVLVVARAARGHGPREIRKWLLYSASASAFVAFGRRRASCRAPTALAATQLKTSVTASVTSLARGSLTKKS